jgi:biopolymer transport protein ExbB/TolQ
VSKYNVWANAAIRSPILWGLTLSAGFFAAIHTHVITDAMVIRYLAGHWVEYVETVMFCVGLSALVLKGIDLLGQRHHVDDELIGEVPEGGQEPEAAVELLQHVQERRDENSYLVRRVRETLDLVRRTGSAEGIEDHLKYLSELDASRAAQSYGLVRFVVWAIPIMGFLGTVIGITVAIASLSPTQLDDITGVVSGLGTAFDTTASALALSMVLMFLQFLVDRLEQSLLGKVDENGSALAIARLGDAIGRSTAKLLDAQAESWRRLEQSAGERMEEFATMSGAQMSSGLATALDQTLSKWTKSLVEAQESLMSQRETRWEVAGETMAVAMRSVERQHEALQQQGLLLSSVVDATRDLRSLEQALEDNLNAVVNSGKFDETMSTLAAAIQLFASRVGAEGAAWPRVVLNSKKSSRKTA